VLLLKQNKKRGISLLLTVILVAIIAWVGWHSRGRMPTPAFGGQTMNRLLKDDYNYQQRDARWGSQQLGEQNRAGTLASHGCTVSAIANALSNLDYPITPGELNQQMSARGGFNKRGWLVWGALEQVTQGRAHAVVFTQPRLADVDHCLEKGQYPIVKYLIGGVVQHWVTIVGKQGRRYLIRDPLIDQPDPITLHSRTPIMLSVRCIGAAPAG